MNEHLNELKNSLSSITASKPSSAILLAAGITSSQHSVSVQVGNRLEKWWKSKVNTLDDSAANRQVDFFAKTNGKKCYFEIKCNTNLDSEKLVATKDKIDEVKKDLKADIAEVFNPVVNKDYFCPRLKRNVLGVESVLKLFNLGFTVEQYRKTWTDVVKELFKR